MTSIVMPQQFPSAAVEICYIIMDRDLNPLVPVSAEFTVSSSFCYIFRGRLLRSRTREWHRRRTIHMSREGNLIGSRLSRTWSRLRRTNESTMKTRPRIAQDTSRLCNFPTTKEHTQDLLQDSIQDSMYTARSEGLQYNVQTQIVVHLLLGSTSTYQPINNKKPETTTNLENKTAAASLTILLTNQCLSPSLRS